MFRSSIRWAAVLGTTTCLVLGPVSESQAFFGFFRRRQAEATNAVACVAQPTCAPQVVNYVPQTAYRTQYVSVPVTTYRPTASYDATTGCPVNCMRPVTTYCTQARLVAYTTYRLQYSNPCANTAPVAAASYYQPNSAYQASTTFQPSTIFQPSTQYQPAPTFATPGYGAQPGYQPGVNYGPAQSGCSTCSQGGGAAMPQILTVPSTQAYSVPNTPSYAAPSYSPPSQSYATPTYSAPVQTYAAPSQGTSTFSPASPPQVALPSTTYAQSPPYTQPAPTVQGTVTYPPTTVYPGPTTYPTPPAFQNNPTAPTVNPGSTPATNGGVPSTFENGNSTTTSGLPAGGMRPIEDPQRNTQARPMSGPGLIDPRSRTTSMPMYRAGAYSLVSLPEAARTAAPIAQLVPAITPDTYSQPVQYQAPITAPQPVVKQYQPQPQQPQQPQNPQGWKTSRR